MMKWLCMVFVAVMGVGCTTTSKGGGRETSGGEVGANPTAVPPDKMDEIRDIMNRKSQDAAHCWREEAERTKNPQVVVDLLVGLTVGPSGKATSVRVLKNTYESTPQLEECITGMIKAIDFPIIGTSVEMTWPYTFKALY
jgi:hypothetical protein